MNLHFHLKIVRIRIAGQRREAKADRNKTRRLNVEFQRAARKDKEIYWQQSCMKLEEDCQNGHTRDLFAQVRKFQTPFTACKVMIKDKNGRVLTDQQGIRARWQEYTGELYASTSNGEQPNYDPMEIEPAILNEEIVWAMQQLPNNKAPGFDFIQVELLRLIPPVAIKTICQKIWETMKWPKDWEKQKNVFILIPKKYQSCNYCTIALIPHTSKILLKIIPQRLLPIIETELPDLQAGFRRGRGTCDHIANLWWIIEKCNEYQKSIYMHCIDYSKAFDCVEHHKLWKIFQELGVSAHLMQLIR